PARGNEEARVDERHCRPGAAEGRTRDPETSESPVPLRSRPGASSGSGSRRSAYRGPGTTACHSPLAGHDREETNRRRSGARTPVRRQPCWTKRLGLLLEIFTIACHIAGIEAGRSGRSTGACTNSVFLVFAPSLRFSPR